jgi:2'-5' RNA ligase
MYYAVVYYPELDRDKVDPFRQKHDPYAALIAPHLPFVFPVPDSIGEEALVAHLEHVLSAWPPFDVHLSGFEKSWDHWLLLVAKEGREEVIRLHKDLYTGILAPHLRTEFEFIPHVGLGLFAVEAYDPDDPKAGPWDEGKYRRALEEAARLDLDGWHRIERLVLIGLNETYTQCWNVRELPLTAGGRS